MKLLLTAFDPFGGEKINPALEAVKRVQDKIGDLEIVKLEVPTVFYKSIDTVTNAIEKEHPDVVLCIGQAGGRFDITPERVAININDARIPDNEGNHFIAVAVYCIGMALFTMIMGNGFAAFAVITVGIGYPFLIAQGANPVVVGALGLTAGYCGTLMTPMAANFNIMPAALLETKSKYAIIISQLPVALIMLAVHIVLMYVLAF